MTERRKQELLRIRRTLERLHSPRLQMMLIVALTAATGFLSSVLLLSGGMESMWLRYAIAVAFAYGAFLFFLWCWLRLRWDDYLDVPTLDVGGGGGGGSASVDTPLPWDAGGGQFGGGGASGSFDAGSSVNALQDGSSGSDALPDIGSAADVFDAEELVVVVIALVALASAIAAAVWIVWLAPAFFAELTLDAALATGLYRRLRGVSGDHWLRTAIRKTVWLFAGVALLFSIAGAAMQMYAPDAKSIGHVIRQMQAQ